jgi:four helix bundle protein
MTNSSFRELTVYKKAFSLSMELFHLTKTFPADEKFVLSSQVRRSSRSVCSNIGEGYRKRKYPAHFVSKTSDADMENSETQVWLDYYALACEYISKEKFAELLGRSEEVGKLLNHMINFPEKYIRKEGKQI